MAMEDARWVSRKIKQLRAPGRRPVRKEMKFKQVMREVEILPGHFYKVSVPIGLGITSGAGYNPARSRKTRAWLKRSWARHERRFDARELMVEFEEWVADENAIQMHLEALYAEDMEWCDDTPSPVSYRDEVYSDTLQAIYDDLDRMYEEERDREWAREAW